MNYIRYKLNAIISSIAGLISGILAWIVFLFIFPDNAVYLGIITGLGTVIVMFPLLVLKDFLENKRYSLFEAELGSKIVHSIKAYMETKNGLIRSKVYFTEERIYFACVNGKKFIKDNLCLSEIFTVVTDGVFSLNIYTKDKQIFKLSSPEVPEILPFIKNHSANMQNK